MKVTMPQIGDFSEPYELVEWFCNEGDHVEVHAPLCSVEVGKATMDVESPQSGALSKMLVAVGQKISPGAELCEIAEL